MRGDVRMSVCQYDDNVFFSDVVYEMIKEH